MDVVPEDLDRLVRQVWLFNDEDSPVRVSKHPLPETHVTVESYAVLPISRRRRYLVPINAKRAVAAATYHVPHSHRFGSRGTHALARAVAGSAVTATRLSPVRIFVGIEKSVPRHRWREHLLLSRIAAELDVPELVALLPVRRAMPTAKPILRLFDHSGKNMGVGKVAWSPATERILHNEAAVLRDLTGRLARLQIPDVQVVGAIDSKPYLVTTPASPPLTAWTHQPAFASELVLDVARSGGLTTEALASSRFRVRLETELAAARGSAPELTGILGTWLSALAAQEAADLTFGRWHGDWTRWNVVDAAGSAFAWDWEFSEPSCPVGFDLVHWNFQHALADRHTSLAAAVRTAYKAAPTLATVGVEPAQQRLIASLYIIEILTRACRLNAEAGRWNPRIYPAALAVAARCRSHDASRARLSP